MNRVLIFAVVALAAIVLGAAAQNGGKSHPAGWRSSAASAPKPGEEYTSEMRPLLEWYSADRINLQRFYDVEGSQARRERLTYFYKNWLGRLNDGKFDTFSQAGKIDY